MAKTRKSRAAEAPIAPLKRDCDSLTQSSSSSSPKSTQEALTDVGNTQGYQSTTYISVPFSGTTAPLPPSPSQPTPGKSAKKKKKNKNKPIQTTETGNTAPVPAFLLGWKTEDIVAFCGGGVGSAATRTASKEKEAEEVKKPLNPNNSQAKQAKKSQNAPPKQQQQQKSATAPPPLPPPPPTPTNKQNKKPEPTPKKKQTKKPEPVPENKQTKKPEPVPKNKQTKKPEPVPENKQKPEPVPENKQKPEPVPKNKQTKKPEPAPKKKEKKKCFEAVLHQPKKQKSQATKHKADPIPVSASMVVVETVQQQAKSLQDQIGTLAQQLHQLNLKLAAAAVAAAPPVVVDIADATGRHFIVIDTCALMRDGATELINTILKQGETRKRAAVTLLVPVEVVRELDALKVSYTNHMPHRQIAARKAISLLGKVQSACYPLDVYRGQKENEAVGVHGLRRGDDGIIDCMLQFRRAGAVAVDLVTADKNFALRAKTENFMALTVHEAVARVHQVHVWWDWWDQARDSSNGSSNGSADSFVDAGVHQQQVVVTVQQEKAPLPAPIAAAPSLDAAARLAVAAAAAPRVAAARVALKSITARSKIDIRREQQNINTNNSNKSKKDVSYEALQREAALRWLHESTTKTNNTPLQYKKHTNDDNTTVLQSSSKNSSSSNHLYFYDNDDDDGYWSEPF